MGKFKDFVLMHLGKDEPSKALYKYLVEHEYNTFTDYKLCTDFDGSVDTHPQIASRKLRHKLATLKEVVGQRRDYSAPLKFEQIYEQLALAKQKQCLISQLGDKSKDDATAAAATTTAAATAAAADESGLLSILRTVIIAQLNPYETISESHSSEQDSKAVRAASSLTTACNLRSSVRYLVG
jgi:hypothetical protein